MKYKVKKEWSDLRYPFSLLGDDQIEKLTQWEKDNCFDKLEE